MQRFNLEGRLNGLQELPIAQEFIVMNFSPRFDESLLGSVEIASDTLDRVKSERGSCVLISGMEMRPVARYADFHQHSNHDSEESGNLGHL
jgi:hypothetical protein